MFTKGNNSDSVTNSVFLLDRYTDTAIGFEFFTENLEPNTFSICNQRYVSSCINVPVPVGLDIISVEFIATDDPCFQNYQIEKTSDDDIELTTEDNQVVYALVKFNADDSFCYPNQMTYRLYGLTEDTRIVLSQGLIVFK